MNLFYCSVLRTADHAELQSSIVVGVAITHARVFRYRFHQPALLVVTEAGALFLSNIELAFNFTLLIQLIHHRLAIFITGQLGSLSLKMDAAGKIAVHSKGNNAALTIKFSIHLVHYAAAAVGGALVQLMHAAGQRFEIVK